MASLKSCGVFILLSLSATIVHAVVYNDNNQATFHGGKYKLYWAFNSSEDKIYFKVEAETTGYVALGFSDQGDNMRNLDCVVAGVESGKGYIMDLKASDIRKPNKDQQQDYVLESSSETGSKTTVEFSRKRETGDKAHDMTFVSGQAVHVAWAYGTNDAATYQAFSYHRQRGYSPKKLVFVSLQPTPTTKATSTPSHQNTPSVAASMKPNLLNATVTSKSSPTSSPASSPKMSSTVAVLPTTNNRTLGSKVTSKPSPTSSPASSPKMSSTVAVLPTTNNRTLGSKVTSKPSPTSSPASSPKMSSTVAVLPTTNNRTLGSKVTSKPSPTSSPAFSPKMSSTVAVSPTTNNRTLGSKGSCNSVCCLVLFLVFLTSTLFV